MLVFLSFAPDDGVVAERIAEWLSQRHHRICSRRRTRVDDPEVSGTTEHKIGQADAFIAVMSPSFLASASCRRERELALHREPPGATGGPYFIHVVKVAPTPYIDTGALRPRQWVNMTSGLDMDAALSELDGHLAAGVRTASTPAGYPRREPPLFHNRETELKEVLDGLTDRPRQDFWRVVAPPQLGKSWFLDRIDIYLEERVPEQWTVKLVDVREKPTEVRASAEALLGMLFGADGPVSAGSDGVTAITGRLNEAGKFHLCLLDSAELLDKRTADTLRDCLSQIHREVSKTAREGVRLAVIVASRGQGWSGVSQPRLKRRPLSEFTVDIVMKALSDMSVRQKYGLGPEQLRLYATRIHRLCEGLPALLYQYLSWIQVERWAGLDRLLEEQQFSLLTHPYIERELLSEGSLFGPGAAPTDEQRRCIAAALQILVPYRLYTRAHLSQHAGPLQPLLEPMGWTMEKLLVAVNGTDLLYQADDQPWEVIYEPIRRLLCRYWYPSDASLAYAHTMAGQFIRSWGDSQSGYEEAVALVECLWHESQVLSLNRAVNPEQKLIGLAMQMSTALTESPGWTPGEIRRIAANRMSKDDELVEAAANISVSIDDLVDAVMVSQP